MVELGDHQLLPFLRALAFAGGEIGKLQNHFEQRDTQGLPRSAVRPKSGRGLAVHRLLPKLRKLLRG